MTTAKGDPVAEKLRELRKRWNADDDVDLEHANTLLDIAEAATKAPCPCLHTWIGKEPERLNCAYCTLGDRIAALAAIPGEEP